MSLKKPFFDIFTVEARGKIDIDRIDKKREKIDILFYINKI